MSVWQLVIWRWVEPTPEAFCISDIKKTLDSIHSSSGVNMEIVGVKVSQFPETITVWHICDETWF